MDSTLLAQITPAHAQRLAWFEDHEGDVTGIPEPLGPGLFLVSKPKGIYKPLDLDYALSIRTNLGSPYEDGQVQQRPGGGWSLSYHQEGADPGQRDRMFTNRGLMRCIEDHIPVGVLSERPPVHGRSQYEVLGLAMPVGWHDGYFLFESVAPEGVPVRDTFRELLEAQAEADVERDVQAAPPPADDYDARLRLYRQIVARRGQANFRTALIAAYSGRCAITACGVRDVLEAAHLKPYRGPESNVVNNGVLLRADIHTLLDLQLIAFHPDNREIVIAKSLVGTDYDVLAGRKLAEPNLQSQRPAAQAIDKVWQEFLSAEGARGGTP